MMTNPNPTESASNNLNKLHSEWKINPEWEKLDERHDILRCSPNAYTSINVGPPPPPPPNSPKAHRP
jgi:hypothetical protein